MRLYCMCHDGPNRFTEPEKEADSPVMVTRSMSVEKNGVEQRLEDGSRHYPNVDLYECRDCGVKIIRE